MAAIIKTEHLTHVYGEGMPDATTALDDINIEIEEGEFVGVIGSTGSGKSTLLSLLSGSLKVQKGPIEVNGKRLEKLSRRGREDYLLRTVGLLPQGFHLLEDRTALFNASLPLRMAGWKKREAEKAALEGLKAVGLQEAANRQASLLSGGEKARLAFVRSSIKKPPLLLADEPTGNLDLASSRAIMGLLKKESASRLVIVVSHDENLSKEYVDGCLRLRDGRVVEAVLPPGEAGSPISGKKARGFSYLSGTFFRSLKTDRGKLALTFLSSLVASSLIIFAASYALGAKQAVEEESRLSLSYLSLSYSVVEKKEETGLLTLSRTRRPTAEERGRLLLEDSSVRVVPDFSYYLPSSYPITVNGFPKDETSLVPVWDFSYLLHPSWSGRVEGEELSGNPLGYCAVNKAFEEELGEEAVGKTIRIKRDIHLEADDLTEDFQIDFSFVVSAVVDEFSFMGIPRVYFSYQALAGYLRNVEFLTLAGNPCSYVEEAPDDSPVSSYRSLVFASSPSSVERLANLDPLFEGFSLSSEAVAASASLSELSTAFLLLIEPFLLLVVGAGFFLLFSLAYASFLSRRREFAILSSLGARQGDLLLLTSLGPALVSFLSSLLATGLSPLLLSGGRAYFAAKAGLALLAPSLPLLAYLVLAASFFFIPLFGSLIPLLRGSFRSLHEELSEE